MVRAEQPVPIPAGGKVRLSKRLIDRQPMGIAPGREPP
jgi:hypothetical protein